jgi:predicted ATPase
MIFDGRGKADAGDAGAGIQQMEQALGMYRGVGSGMVVPYFLVQLAEAYAATGETAQALAKLDDARQLVAQGGEAIALAEIDRVEGQIRRQRGEDAECWFQQALQTARAQGATLFETRVMELLEGTEKSPLQ